MVVAPYSAACYIFSLFCIFALASKTSKFHGGALLTFFYTSAQFIIKEIFLISVVGHWDHGWEIRFLLHWMKAAS